MLRLEAVTYAHRGTAQTYRFDMQAEPGAVTAVSGPSGSGKSTLLDLIAGFLTPTAGRMDLDGHDLLPLPPEQRPVSLLFQSESLFDHLSAGRNVALGLPQAVPARERDRLIAEALKEVGWSASKPSAPARCRAARSSASPSPARCCAPSRSCCSTSRSRRWTTKRA